MLYRQFVIKVNNKGTWEYYYKRSNGVTQWDSAGGIYGASKFDTKEEAESTLEEKCKSEHWGGAFQIDEIFISK